MRKGVFVMSELLFAAAERASFSWATAILGLLPALLVISAVVVVIVLLVHFSKKSSARPQQPWPQNPYPQTRPQAQPPHPGGSLEEQLQALQGMVEKGLITQEDYDAKKKQLLGL